MHFVGGKGGFAYESDSMSNARTVVLFSLCAFGGCRAEGDCKQMATLSMGAQGQAGGKRMFWLRSLHSCGCKCIIAIFVCPVDYFPFSLFSYR